VRFVNLRGMNWSDGCCSSLSEGAALVAAAPVGLHRVAVVAQDAQKDILTTRGKAANV
jgi:hypothetical protein